MQKQTTFNQKNNSLFVQQVQDENIKNCQSYTKILKCNNCNETINIEMKINLNIKQQPKGNLKQQNAKQQQSNAQKIQKMRKSFEDSERQKQILVKTIQNLKNEIELKNQKQQEYKHSLNEKLQKQQQDIKFLDSIKNNGDELNKYFVTQMKLLSLKYLHLTQQYKTLVNSVGDMQNQIMEKEKIIFDLKEIIQGLSSDSTLIDQKQLEMIKYNQDLQKIFIQPPEEWDKKLAFQPYIHYEILNYVVFQKDQIIKHSVSPEANYIFGKKINKAYIFHYKIIKINSQNDIFIGICNHLTKTQPNRLQKKQHFVGINLKMKEFSLGIIQEEKDKFRRKSWAGHVISMVVNLYLNKLIFKHQGKQLLQQDILINDKNNQVGYYPVIALSQKQDSICILKQIPLK